MLLMPHVGSGKLALVRVTLSRAGRLEQSLETREKHSVPMRTSGHSLCVCACALGTDAPGVPEAPEQDRLPQVCGPWIDREQLQRQLGDGDCLVLHTLLQRAQLREEGR